MAEITRRFARLLTLLSGLSAIAATFQAVPSLVIYLKFEEAAGNAAADSGPNGFNGTWQNTAYVQASAVGDCAPNSPANTRSIIFTKPAAVTTNGGYVNVPNNAAFTFTGPFSVMAWIKPTTYSAGDNPNDTGAIVQKWDWLPGPAVLRGWAMNRNLSGTIYFHTGTSTTQNFLTTSATVGIGTWTHVACVYDGATKFIYLNGALSTSAASTLNPEASPADLHIGKDDWARNFYGNVDDVRLFGGALTAAQVNAYYVGVPPPTGLTATPGINSVTLDWTAVANATGYNILRGGTTGGPYTQIGTVTAPTVTYTDNTAVYPNTYFYVVQTVQGTVTSSNSTEVTGTPLPAPVSASPTALQTSELPTTAQFNVTFNVAAPAVTGSTVTVTSNDPTEGLVSSAGNPVPAAVITIAVAPGFTGNIPITVTGVDDAVADGPVTYPISITATNMGGPPVPNVMVTNNDNDTPNITISATSGLVTSEGGGTATFTVTLATQPTSVTTMSVVSSNTAEGTVNPGTLTFSAANWNTPHLVTLTGVDDTVLDFAVGYTINLTVTGGDLNYMALTSAPNGPRQVSVINLDNEPIPTLPTVWGCGLLGAEIFLPLGLLSLLRRRRRNG